MIELAILIIFNLWKGKKEERGRKKVNWTIKLMAKYKMSERGRKFMNVSIEIESKNEMSERRRKIGYWLIE